MKKWMLIVSLLLFGCASAPPAVFINNEPAPKKIYTLNSTAIPVSATALFYATVPVKDVDGDTTYRLAYLPINENLEFSRTEIAGLFVRVSVVNLQKNTYNVKYTLQLSYSDGRAEGKVIQVGRSGLDSRTFTIPIPTPPGMEKGSFRLLLTDDKGQELLNIGDLKYKVYTPMTSR